MTRRRPPAALLLALPVLAALGLGAWGIGFGLPFQFRPDEDVLVGRAVTMAVRHSLDPLFYDYPPLGLWLFAAADWLLGLLSPGSLGSPARVDPTLEYEAARWVSVAAFGAATAFTGLAGRALYGTGPGLLAAAALAVAPLAVLNAHFGRVDEAAIALLCLSLWLGARAAGGRGFALAGAAAGLGAATKYTSGVALVFLLLLSLQGPDRGRRAGAAVAGAAIAFLAAMAPAGHPLQYLEGLRFLGGRALGGYGGLPVGAVFHLEVSLPAGMGYGGLLLGAGGLVLALRRRGRADLALGGYLLAAYLLTGFTHEVFTRYALPMLPALCLLAGGLLAGPEPGPAGRRRLAAAAALLLLPALAASAAGDLLLGQADTRVLAARWLAAHAPAGSRLEVANYWSEPYFDAAAVAAEPLHPYYLAGDPLPDSFQLGAYTDRFAVNRPGSPCFRFDASGPPWQAPPPSPPGPVLATFLPYSPGSPPRGVYDPLDSFFLPLVDLGGVERPGPAIVISAC